MMAAVAVPIAFGLEVAVGEPPRRFHPVAWFGWLSARLDREWAHPGAVGLALALLGPCSAAAVVGLVVGTVASASIPLGIIVAGVALFVTTSWRRLISRARSMIAASETDPEAARAELPALVGRNPDELSPGQVRSAAVESAAENLADGLVAPLSAFIVAGTLGASIGPVWALAAGAGAATWVKAVNTLDSMIGYWDRPHGRAAARLDDVVMWVPARLTAVLLAVAATSPGVLWTVRPWLDGVASPNAGWPMGTIAALVGCRLEKPGVYVLNADASLPDTSVALAAVRTVAWGGLATYGLATVVVALGVLAWS